MDVRKVMIAMIIMICIFSIAYGIYNQITLEQEIGVIGNIRGTDKDYEVIDFDKVFDNKINYQSYNTNAIRKLDNTKDLIYTSYNLNETSQGKYDIKVSIPFININSEKIEEINKEIASNFQDRATTIMATASRKDVKNTVYTVDYGACLNENILSLAIRATIKEGNNNQKVIINTYTYNVSTNEEIDFKNMLEIKGIKTDDAKKEIKKAIQDEITRLEKLETLAGYSTYKRDINNSIYEIENTDSFFLGENGTLYIIYAYGNNEDTSEKDVVVIK